jgi:hypothetical protein
VFVVLSQCVPDGHNLEISQDKAIPSFTDQQMFFDRGSDGCSITAKRNCVRWRRQGIFRHEANATN